MAETVNLATDDSGTADWLAAGRIHDSHSSPIRNSYSLFDSMANSMVCSSGPISYTNSAEKVSSIFCTTLKRVVFVPALIVTVAVRFS